MNQIEQKQRNALATKKRISIIRTYAVKERSFPSSVKRISDPKQAAELVRPLLENLDREYLIVVCVDVKARPISVEIASIGLSDNCLVGVKEVFRNAILSNASGILLYHNHPSGSVRASKEDILITDKLIKAGELLGIPLIDHIIIGERNRYYSFAEKRCINKKGKPLYMSA